MPSYILVLLLNVIIALVPICMCRLVSAAIMRLHCIRVLIAVIILKPLVLVLVALAAMLSRSLLVGSIRRVRDVIIADLLSLLAPAIANKQEITRQCTRIAGPCLLAGICNNHLCQCTSVAHCAHKRGTPSRKQCSRCLMPCSNPTICV